MPTGAAPRILNPTTEAVTKDTAYFKEPQKGQAPNDTTRKGTQDERVVTDAIHPTHQQLPPIDTSANSKPPELPPQDFDVSDDLYKKKIEALRQDFGNSWLSALGDDGWDSTSATSFPSEHGYNSPTIRPTLARTPSQGIASGGRTLG
jgi:hypothetical protein